MAAVPAAEELPPLVDVGNKGGIVDVSVGKTNPEQRLLTLEAAQHESVAFGELAAQYPQRPCKLEENPQLFGSFSSPVIHCWLRESLGRAQLVKSALI